MTMGVQTTKILRALISLLAYFAALAGVYYVHVRFFKVDVVLYGAIVDALLAALLALPILHFARLLSPFNGFERLQLFAIWLMCGYIFAISVPTVIDRSLSFYILEKLQQRGGGILLHRFDEVLTDEYFWEYRVLDVRLTEQEASGTIVVVDGCVRLTERGARLARFSGFFRKHLLPSQRLVGGAYSDALLDPFRHDNAKPDYGCGAQTQAGPDE
jgi:hypothetical protein